MKPSPRFLISGYYGFGNAGDEAILAGLVAGFRELMPSAELTVLSGDPADTMAEHGVVAVARGLRSARKNIRLSDAVISGGGGLLQDATSWRSPIYYVAILQMARFARRPVACIGQSIGPLRRPWVRALVRASLSGVDAISVRDEMSRDALRSIGLRRSVESSADLAFLLPKPTDADVTAVHRKAGIAGSVGPFAAVALRRLPGAGVGDTAVRQAAAAIGRACEALDVRPLLIPMQPQQDFGLAHSIASAMPAGAIVAPAMSARDILALIGGCRLVIAMRLHALIFAALCGVPPVAISYDPKVDGVMQQLGLESAASLPRLNEAQLERSIRQAHACRGEISAALASRLPALRSLALRNIELAISVLPGR